MLFDDADMLSEALNYGVFDAKFRDENDPVVERLYNTSPPLLEQVPSYEMDSVLGIECDTVDDLFMAANNGGRSRGVSDAQRSDRSGGTSDNGIINQLQDNNNCTSLNNVEPSMGSDEPNRILKSGDTFDADHDDSFNKNLTDLNNRTIEVINIDKKPSIEANASSTSDDSSSKQNTETEVTHDKKNETFLEKNTKVTVTSSNLTLLMNQNNNNHELTNSLKLRIYLPDCTPMDVSLPESITFGSAVKKLLEIHQERHIIPALHYDYLAYKRYALCMHEGDGEPDLDFIFDKKRKILEFYNPKRPRVNEYCLCEIVSTSSEGLRPSLARTTSLHEEELLADMDDNYVMIKIPGANPDVKCYDITKIIANNNSTGIPFTGNTTMLLLLIPLQKQKLI